MELMTGVMVVLAVIVGVVFCMAVNEPVTVGLATLVWGVDGKVDSPGTAEVKKISFKPKNSGFVGECENANGATLGAQVLNDGFSATVELNYDTALTWPAEGAFVVLTLLKFGAAGGTQTYDCVLTSYGGEMAPKSAATVTMNLEHRPGISKPA